MNFPFITKDKYEHYHLCFNEDDCYSFKDNEFAFWTAIDEAKPKNYTEEFLANTYGEVKSKEHAEFIVKLAEANGFEIGQVDDNPKSFMIYDNVICTHRLSHNQLSNGFNRKQITIPLPPKCESVDEWPKVGDKVLISDDVQIHESYGFKGKTCKVIGICESEGKKVLTLEHESLGLVAFNMGEWIKKPKTPEQELRDELISDFREIGQSGIVLIGMYDKVVDEFLSKYNITKKPQ